MSQEFKVTLPKLGESILSATVVQWFKEVGDRVELDEPLLEVSTDKVNSEIPSPFAGVVKEILAQPNQELGVGEALAIISGQIGSATEQVVHTPKAAAVQESTSTEMQDYFSPSILRLAHEKGVALEELKRVSPTGEGGRITKKDLETYLEKKCPLKAAPAPAQSSAAEIERLKMTGMRKAIADNMVRSFYQAPHATVIHEVDVTDLMKVIQKEKEAFAARHGVKLTITAFIARAISKAIQEYPLINSSLEQDTIVLKHFVNLGIAVSVDQGIMVPVVKQCHRLSLPEIARAISDLASRAHAGKLAPDEVADGTISMTNFGMSGVLIGIPIIRFPEVAIVGIGSIHKKVAALDNDLIGIRNMVHVSLTFDHRVLDGMYGCGFLGSLKAHIEHDLTL